MKTMRAFTSIAFAGLILLAACGGGGNDGGSTEGGGASSTVTLRDNEFAPADPVIGAGAVELVNEGEPRPTRSRSRVRMSTWRSTLGRRPP